MPKLNPSLRVDFRSRQWRRFGIPVLAATALGGGILWQGADRKPSDATQPLQVRGEISSFASATDTLRIGTFNIHGGRGPEGDVDLGATATLLESADLHLVGLYEVHGSYGTDQAEALGERLEMASLFAGTERRWWHDHFGNGMLTNLPIENVIRISLPGTQGKRFRNALLSTVDLNGISVNVIAAHLDTEIDRERQLAAVIGLFKSLEAPAVLMGDLNCTVEHPLLRELLADPEVVDAVSERLGTASQKGRIDHVLTRGLITLDASVVPNRASDHPFVWAELRPIGKPLSSQTVSLQGI